MYVNDLLSNRVSCLWSLITVILTQEQSRHLQDQLQQYPEQNYKSCLGVLHLEKKAGRERLENACLRAMEYQTYNYSIVKRILEKGLDLLEEKQLELTLPKHNNIRGNNYYQ